ncbi:MAG TPA: DUF1045 domain-containing protein, partial [Alphaproteobacteria bacterium]|nr:DUF1045 domain-containing protein [Alphaproteobacteria bacterium]
MTGGPLSEPRYAIYFAPAPGSALEAFGRRWFSGEDWSTVPGIPAERLAALLESPRHYGFHATLKPPFALADGTDEAGLMAALAAFARAWPRFSAPPLAPRPLGRFLALQPEGESAELTMLAADCVRAFDGFRA